MRPKLGFVWVLFLAVGVVIGLVVSSERGNEARAQGGSPVQTNVPKGRTPAPIVDGVYPATYFPNTELLGPDEMRITALGTGMPNQTRAAVSISFLVELGNGDVFVFDAGSGMLANLFSLRPDFSKIDKVFVEPSPRGPCGGLPGAPHRKLAIRPLHTDPSVYGPSGSTPALGTEGLSSTPCRTGYAWDIATRTGALPDAGRKDRGPRVRLHAG